MKDLDRHLNVFDADGNELDSLLVTDKEESGKKCPVDRISLFKKSKIATGKSEF